MASTLSEEEFCRLQEQLLDLRTSNYNFEEKCRKQHNELSTLHRKLEVLDKEYQKVSNIVNKSKKAKDVELLLQENQNLQLKLQSQEDEFSLQNTTLMKELSMLVSSNEKLERDLKALTDGARPDTQSSVGEIARLQNDLRRLHAENTALHTNLTDTKLRCEDEISNLKETLRLLQQSDEEDSDLVSVGEQEVTYKKSQHGSNSVLELLRQSESKVEVLDKQVKELGDLKIQLQTEQEENKLMHQELEILRSSQQSQSSNLQEELERVNEKLKKKQESVVQLQSEKEMQYTESKKNFEEMQAVKDEQIHQLKEELQLLHTNLNNNTQLYQGFQQKAAKVVEDLKARVAALQSELNGQTAAKVQELEADKIIRNVQLSEARTELEDTKQERDCLLLRVQETTNAADELANQVQNLREENAKLMQMTEEAKKIANKRKSLLDDMAIHLQKKDDEHKQEVAKMAEEYSGEIARLFRNLEEEKIRSMELEGTKLKLEQLTLEVKSLEGTKGWFERQLAEVETNLENEKSQHKQNLSSKVKEHTDEVVQMKQEYALQIKDLETQLEISNVQRTEYEELVEKLKQDAKDGIEERKIHEKKGTSIVKDLKRQLQMERKRAEKLQERLQEALNDSNQTRNVEVNAFKPLVDVGDKAETSSISSWSLMSGQLENNRDTTDGSGNGSLQNGNSPTPPSVLEQENNDLLCRVTAMQQEKWILEEKVNHLEQSNSAMAEDLIEKQAVIQFYCMEGRSDPHPHHSLDKLTVRRVVDFIKDKGDENQREINRKLQRSLEETLTKNMCLQKDLEAMTQQLDSVAGK